MALTELYTQSALSVSTTELSLTGGTSTIQTRTAQGLYFARIWVSSIAKGDKFTLRVYEKVISSDSQRLAIPAIFIEHSMSSMLFIPPIWLKHGWDYTAQRTAGSDRNFIFSLFQIA